MNALKMAKIESVLRLHSFGWSFRRIARELGIHRETVSRVVKRHQSGSKAAIAPTGSEASKPATLGALPAPSGAVADGTELADSAAASKPATPPSKPAIAPSGSGAPVCTESSLSPAPIRFGAGRPNKCEPYHEFIVAKLAQELTAQRIFQDLVEEHGFTGNYYSVRRYVARLGQVHEWPMRRMEQPPGREAQVDYGTGVPVIDAEGRRRRTHLFRFVLSHSRKAYSEVAFRQTTDEFLRCLENALWHFGGVPETLVIDNLKAAVKHPDWFDPELVPKVAAFCSHYGVVILPTKIRMPRHKGKVERGVGYAQENALKGRRFASLEAQNEHLTRWEQQVADQRIHGTTQKQVEKAFQDAERTALKPLPLERFQQFQEAQRKVNRDGHVEVVKAFYSVPPEYLGRTVWVRWDARLVRIINQRLEQIAIHVRGQRGQFSTQGQHIAAEKISGLERGAEYLLRKVQPIGPHVSAWAEAMLHARGIAGTRVLQGLVALRPKHSCDALNAACEIALSHGEFRLRTLRRLLARNVQQKQEYLAFLEQHPIIRPLDDYAQVVAAALERTGRRHDDRNKDAETVRGVFRGITGQKNVSASWHDLAASSKQTAPMVETSGAVADIPPPRSGYPSPGCSPAEPDSVSPDHSNVIAARSVDQFPVPSFHPENTP
jgi:transposase